MVNGVARLRAQFNKVPNLVLEEIHKVLEKSARQTVAEMNALKPWPEIQIDWTWGDVPAGALSIGTVRGKEYGRVSIKIFATATSSEFPSGFAALTFWAEFGTDPRYHKSGKYTGRITAQPYFYPVLRSNEDLLVGRIKRAVNKGMKRANS